MTASSPIRARIETKLTEGLMPEALVVRDDSRRHASHGPRMAALGSAGHAPLDGGGETHFTVHIVSAAFTGRSRLERHRMVHALLAEELRERVHALTVRARAPDEVRG
ncbi:BolA family protein [Roseospira visakhapatnamensis]|uniref:BolA protein n=1 Tax=Roseospira visakhapatnamensis TaxID=390880 RepID=A0A7W6RCH7_9PROT|nr:BolA family protein [Roseospira visakhapatnamensis]MBB4265621.1 BolA protein [Roseospira visakhapatnamensis]